MENMEIYQAIIPLIVAGLAAAGAGAYMGSRERKKQQQEIDAKDAAIAAEQTKNYNWYNANALTDYTQRADAQHVFKNMRDHLKNNRQATTATNRITGATASSVSAQKALDAKAISDTYSNISAMGQRWKDNITNQYFNRKDRLNSQRFNIFNEKADIYDQNAQGWYNLMTSGLNAAKAGV
jgi:hypothetical protein